MDIFSLLAPVYDRLIPVADLETLRGLLGLPCRGALLDLGGGTGRISRHFCKEAEKIVVVDLSRAMLRKGKLVPKVYRVAADAAHLPFRPASFACALVVDALHHFPRQEETIAELVTVLASGGRVVVEEPDIARSVVKVLVWVERLMRMRSRFLPATSIADNLAARGLDVHIRRGSSFAVWVTGRKDNAALGRRPLAGTKPE